MSQEDPEDSSAQNYLENWIKSYLTYGQTLTPEQREEIRKRFVQQQKEASEATKRIG